MEIQLMVTTTAHPISPVKNIISTRRSARTITELAIV